MKRREFSTMLAGAAAWPLAARAQQPAMPVVGFLSGRALTSDANFVAALRRGLGEAGYVEGQNVVIEFRWAEGQFNLLPALAADLVGRRVSVIFAGGMDVEIQSVNKAISTIPVVFATGGDPVELGLVASINRPGGNVTAVTVLTAVLWPKRLELLRELIPSVALVALLLNPANPNAQTIAKDVYGAAVALGLQIRVFNARNDREIDDAFAALKQERAGALLIMADALFILRRRRLIDLAERHAVPVIFDRRDFPADGGLMSYGASTVDQYRQSGRYVGRILKGEKPADLPVMQPTKFELVINLKTARALGLAIPDKLLALADEVIE